MFEDSTFESTGRIKTRSRRWMVVTLLTNGAILTILILLPLVYPDALPRHTIISLIMAPEVPKPEPRPEPVRLQPTRPHNFTELDQGRIIAPGIIPRTPLAPSAPEFPFHPDNLGSEDVAGVASGNGTGVFMHHPVTVVHPAAAAVRLPSSFAEGFLIYKSVPSYPVIAKTARIEGTVVLQAMISKTGTIENLRVISGSPMLQQAAIDAVKTWRYRPYLLNQQPVEVETTVNVIFRLER